MINIYQIYHWLFSNNTEDIIIEILNKNKKKELNIFDIGCYEGNFSKKINDNIKKKINFFFFDPNPTIKDKLKNIKFKYKLFNLAIHNTTNKKIEFYLNTKIEASGSSLVKTVKDSKSYNLSRRLFSFSTKKLFKKIQVETMTLDKFVKKTKLTTIDVLKLDTEGNELNILKGAKNTLKKTNIIYLEILAKKKFYTIKSNLIKKILSKNNFNLIYDKKISSSTWFTDIKAHDLIFAKAIN
jgi:FkbM family methyltransferase